MPKCPSCGKEINSVHRSVMEFHTYKLSLDERGSLRSEPVGKPEVDDLHPVYTCPECGDEIPLSSWRVEDFLKERYIILRSDDPEIRRKKDLILFRGKIYKITMKEKATGLLHLKLVEEALTTDILKADIE